MKKSTRHHCVKAMGEQTGKKEGVEPQKACAVDMFSDSGKTAQGLSEMQPFYSISRKRSPDSKASLGGGKRKRNSDSVMKVRHTLSQLGRHKKKAS
ncbi:hypothetical protein, partial [Sansalvadorimonas verongulae]|uniref:hypothetical protein n=1 Tax=Sansalvadorimonas verongulae TaxID=2172824 RepID=UPI001E3D1FA8